MKKSKRNHISTELERAIRQHLLEMRYPTDALPEHIETGSMPLAEALTAPGLVSAADRAELLAEFKRLARLTETALELILWEPSSAQLREREVLAGAVSSRLAYWFAGFRILEIHERSEIDALESRARAREARGRQEATPAQPEWFPLLFAAKPAKAGRKN